MTLSARILEACMAPKGLSLSELSDAVHDSVDIVNTMAGQMYRDGRICRAGVCRYYRYFTNLADAKAWDLVAEADYIAIRKAFAEKKRLAKNARQRKTNAVVASKRPPKEPPKPKIKKRAEIIYKRQEVVAPKPVNIIWPEHVKVQVHPTPPGRFEFQPPKGWKGEISKDWMNRRLQNVSGVQA